MEELRIELRGKQMTDRPAIRAEEGIPSRPGEHLGLSEARTFSHQAGVVETRERVGLLGATSGGERETQEPVNAEEIVTK